MRLNFIFCFGPVQDHLGQYPIRCLENNGPAMGHFDWLFLDLFLSTAHCTLSGCLKK